MKTQSIIDYMSSFNGTNNDVLELTINHFNIIGDIEEVDLMDLLNFKKLETLTLINLVLDDKSMAILTKLNNLKKLNLINCDLLISNDYKEFLNIKQLLLDNTIFKGYINNNELDYLEIKNQNIDCQNIVSNELRIDKSTINIETINFDNINTLILSDKQFEDNKQYLVLNRKNTKLIVKDSYDEVVDIYD